MSYYHTVLNDKSLQSVHVQRLISHHRNSFPQIENQSECRITNRVQVSRRIRILIIQCSRKSFWPCRQSGLIAVFKTTVEIACITQTPVYDAQVQNFTGERLAYLSPRYIDDAFQSITIYCPLHTV